MLVNHGPSQQGCKEEYEPRKRGAPARYDASHTNVTNEDVRAKIQQAIGPHECLLTIVKRRKLKWYGQISSRQNYLARRSEKEKKTNQTEKKLGRQHQGMDMPGVRQVPEGGREQGGRIKMEGLVVTSSVVPQRALQLKDR